MFTESEKRQARNTYLPEFLPTIGLEVEEIEDEIFRVIDKGALFVRDNQFDDLNVPESIGFHGNAVDFYMQFIKNDYTKAIQALLEFEKARNR